MRLLERNPDSDFILREFTDRDAPAYAILSHIWGEEEVDFQEIEAGTGKDKAGWKKIEFCAKQAGADGLRYIWEDTYCIDKKNAVELSEAISSSFLKILTYITVSRNEWPPLCKAVGDECRI